MILCVSEKSPIEIQPFGLLYLERNHSLDLLISAWASKSFDQRYSMMTTSDAAVFRAAIVSQVSECPYQLV